MLINLISASDASSGIPADNAKLTNRTVSNINIFNPCHSGIRLGLAGVASTINGFGGFNAIGGSEWLIKGTASTFYVRHTIVSGTLEEEPAGGFVWVQLNVNRTYDNVKTSEGTKTTVLFLEISSDASGVPVVATATYTLVSEQGLSV